MVWQLLLFNPVTPVLIDLLFHSYWFGNSGLRLLSTAEQQHNIIQAAANKTPTYKQQQAMLRNIFPDGPPGDQDASQAADDPGLCHSSTPTQTLTWPMQSIISQC